MRKLFFVLPMVVVLVAGIWAAQKKSVISYDKQWKKVEQLADKQLPESALKELEVIVAKATDEKNVQQLIKATLYKMRFTLEKEPDKAPEIIKEFETFTVNTANKVDKALLYSMLAEMYTQYYQSNQWTINSRTEVEGMVPEDIKEWTKNIFYRKIGKLLLFSTNSCPYDLLEANPVKYKLLIDLQKDSRLYKPTLYDFLAYRKIDILLSLKVSDTDAEKMNTTDLFQDAKSFMKLNFANDSNLLDIDNQIFVTYQELLNLHAKKSGTAFFFADLERLKFVHLNVDTEQSDSLYLAALNRLEQQCKNADIAVEILAEKASYYLANDNGENHYKKLAYDICQAGITKYPKIAATAKLKNFVSTILQKQVSVNHDNLVMPNATLKLQMELRNVSAVNVEVFRLNTTAIDYYIYQKDYRNNGKPFLNKSSVAKYNFKVIPDPYFGVIDTTFQIKSGTFGIYEIVVTDGASKSQSTTTNFVVSELGYISRSVLTGLQSLYVLNRASGIPQSNVTVRNYDTRWDGNAYKTNLLNTVETNETGYCTLPYSQNYYQQEIFLERGEDKFFSTSSYPNYYYNQDENKSNNFIVSLFTDRSLYRPGQTVYFKGLAYYADKKRNKVLSSENIEVTLKDANSQKISSKIFKTNEFGSFAGEFVLPDGGLNGQFTLETPNGSKAIFVEEYKRPTFEVKIDKPKEELKFGGKVTFTGNVKAYAGYQMPDAKVKYRVTRASHRYCWWWTESDVQIATGDVVSDADGKFQVEFTAVKPVGKANSWRGNFYTYTLSVDVTDTKGETQQGEQSVSVGDKSLFIVANIPAKMDKNSAVKLPVTTETINGETVLSTINYEVYNLGESAEYHENILDNEHFKVAEKMTSGTYNSATAKLELNTKGWKSGRYKIILKTTDKFGAEVKEERIFVLYDMNDQRPPVKTYKWLLASKTQCKVGENATFRFGTSTENTMVLYELMQGNIVLESKWLKFSNEIQNFEIPFKEEYGAGVNVQFTFMKDEKLFTEKVEISRKNEPKTLKPILSVFRNKLLPGEKAEWTITVPGMKDKQQAEVMAEMYDASLDAIRPHDWNFYPWYNPGVLYSPVWSAVQKQKVSDQFYVNQKFIPAPEFAFDQLNWYGFNLLGYQIVGFSSRRKTIRNFMPKGVLHEEVAFQKIDNVMSVENALQGKIAGLDIKAENGTGPVLNEVVTTSVQTNQNKPVVKPRTNFSETAFFYPQLRTDAKGNVKFTFTAPESLTRWNVKMLAHTPDLYFGQFDTTAVTQKDLMVQMNLPRFVRRSDKLVLVANVTNLSDKSLTAKVSFELIDPASEKTIQLKDAQTKSVTVAPKETKPVEWEVSEFSVFELVTCKVVAEAGNFSDGEQKYLPVLPDKVLITESMPMTIRGNQTRTFNFESLKKNYSKVDTKSLTIEFSSNPAWYAVQALPTLSTPDDDNALSLFTAYYVNSLAGYIANSNPKIAKIFDQWKNVKSSRDALLSNLQKNTELKNMLLEETPWVMAAQNETEQKRQIALLFDLNMQKNQSQQYLDKLLKLQQADGGFSWFEGMPSSRYITQEILLNFARLSKLTNSDLLTAYRLPLTAALRYLDLEISHDFAELKKYNKNYLTENCVGNIQLFYLHMRSEYPDIPVADASKEAVKYYTAQSEKYWTSFTLYGKAMMAVVAQRNGESKIAAEILKSLKENALKTDEFGMYWATNTSGYFWNERPVAVQAAIIEAFAEISKNTADVEEMKIWLLKQKQTQRWDSPVASVNAIYALLLQGNDWLGNEGKVKITAGNKIITPATVEAGTGYFKETIPVNEIRSETGKVTVTKQDKNIGWGAMYWQYFQDQDKVEGQSGALKVTKKLFVKQGTGMIPIEQTQLKKGDKVVTRLVVTTDRNLEYVALKDLRAACFEPVDQRSGCEWKEGLCYYQTTKDASTQFFFSFLPKGTYVFEYEVWANNSGTFTSGITTIQCQYAPEFVSHTGGERINVAP